MRHLIILIFLILMTTACARHHNSDVVDETYVHKYGITVPRDDWNSRGMHGHVITKLNNGVTITKTYVAGVLNGESTYSFAHSETVEKIETYAEGILVKDLTHYRSGGPRQEIQYLSPSTKTVKVWYESASPQCIEHYQDDQLIEAVYTTPSNQLESTINNGEGTRINRDQYGQLVSQDEIESGQLVCCITYHSNGTPKEITPYQNGKPEGLRKTFLPTGEPNTIEEWVNEKQHGTTIIFQNGEKIAEVPYFNGIKNGVEKRYTNETLVVEEVTWKNDLRHGPTHTYVGTTKNTQWFIQGQQVSRNQYDRLSKMNHR